jgi:hypothetical protein
MIELPPSLDPDEYAAWIRADAGGRRAKRIEEMIGTLTLIVPSLVGSAGDLLSEAMTAASGLLNLHHTVLLRGDPTAALTTSPPLDVLPLSPQMERSARWGLSVLACVDVVVELSALKAGGSVLRWKVVSLLEAARAVLKIALVFQQRAKRRLGDRSQPRHLVNGGRVLFPPSPGEEGDAADTEQSAALEGAWQRAKMEAQSALRGTSRGLSTMDILPTVSAASSLAVSKATAGADPSVFWRGSRSGLRLLVPSDVPLPPAGSEASARHSLDEASENLRLAAELLHAMRPAVYAWGRSATGGLDGARASWIPWASSLAIDLTSNGLVWAAESVASGFPSGVVGSASAPGSAYPPGDARGSAGEGLLSLPSSSLADSLSRAAHSFWEPPRVASSGAGGLSPSPPPLGGPASLIRELFLWVFGGGGSRLSTLSAQEATEMRKRQLALLLYLVRDPWWSLVTKPLIDRLFGPIESIPLLGSLIAYARSIAEYYQGLHSHISGAA